MCRKNSLVKFMMVATILTVLCQTALATVVNVDFNGQNDSDSLGPTYVGASPASAGTIWNGVVVDSRPNNYNLTIAASGLTDDTGAATSVGLLFDHVGGDRNQSAGNPLWLDYLGANFGGNGNAPFTISGLGTATTANLYFYHLFDSGTAAPLSITGLGSPTAISPTGIFDNGNTLYYQNVPVTAGSISGTLTIDGGYSLLNGLSVQFVEPVPAPEPGSLVLALCGLTGLAVQRRRKARQSC
jgi:hypothetical protein